MNDKKESNGPKFKTMVAMFVVGALSFAVALSYNNFAQSIINRYSNGTGLKASFINMVVFTGVAILILYVMWRSNPAIVNSAIV